MAIETLNFVTSGTSLPVCFTLAKKMKLFSRLLSNRAISISGGRAEVVKGKIDGRLVRDMTSLCAEIGLQRCELWIDGEGRVSFSREVPSQHHQKFRNVLSIYK
ncbi:DUF3634 family protein [Oceaniferula marina]|uniref:DUF3634 family protein n=1 Tax=Oceaniferula marina TaxID=2748318 RepID=UPI001D056F14|nr:DUF3634 family protein [Oceaniferula marina]